MGFNTVTITTSATKIVAANATRQSLIIDNIDSVTVFIGPDNTVTTSNGVAIRKNGNFTEDNSGGRMYKGDVFGIVATVTDDIDLGTTSLFYKNAYVQDLFLDDTSTYFDNNSGDIDVYTSANKTIELQTVVYEDLRVAVASASRLGFTDPDWVQVTDDGAGSVGVYALGFADNRDEELFFTVQIPHSYKQGTDILPHVHWLPLGADTGVVEWQLEYTWANIDSAFPTTSTATGTDAGAGTANTHQVVSLSTITGTSKNISSMLLCRIHRDGGNGSDTYTGDAVLLEIDFHFQINTMGSRQELVK